MESSNAIGKQGAGKPAVLGLRYMSVMFMAVLSGIMLSEVLPEGI